MWDRELSRIRAARNSATYLPDKVPPLTTSDMVLYLQAVMHMGEWAILKDCAVAVRVGVGLGALGSVLCAVLARSEGGTLGRS